MIFSYFPSVKSQYGLVCTYELFLGVTHSDELKQLCRKIAQCTDADERGKLKKQLPIVTWQASFPGRRVNKEAMPSGLFMLDIDHVDNPLQLYREKIAMHINDCGIRLVNVTASTHGLRIVANCRPEFKTLVECQKWLADTLGVEFDEACKDWARSSYITDETYILYMDGNLFSEEPAEGTIYMNESSEFGQAVEEFKEKVADGVVGKLEQSIDQRKGLFGGEDNYRGIPLQRIIEEWIETTGGPIQKGERNVRLFKLANRMRYITDFNEAVLQEVLPDLGLPQDEFRSIIRNAVSSPRLQSMPRDLTDVIENIRMRDELSKEEGEEEIPENINAVSKMPKFPPLIREWVEIAPADFKEAVALCQLPILGALASRLRAEYIDGVMQSPSFIVSLEAPQASGKSFLTKLVKYEFAQVIDHDNEQREKEREYDNKLKQMKLLNVKINADNKDEILGDRPKSMIRFVPATMSITKLLMRMNDAQGLHLFAFAPEIDTVTKTFKRSFTSYSDLLRVGFDNDLYGQDYASENSFSGMLNIYYNMLNSGTPKAMRRFYPDVEDGLVSRVCFIALPDQFGKKMPVWQDFSDKQKYEVDLHLTRLNESSVVGDEVQPIHVMKMNFLNKALQDWILKQQQEAVRLKDRTRDVFCRRSAVVGFRAGMLAWFLYGEANTPTIRKNVIEFSLWVANRMLTQHILRFNVSDQVTNTIPYKKVFDELGVEFTRIDVERKMREHQIESPIRNVLSRWRMANIIEPLERDHSEHGRLISIKFKKI